MNKVFETTLKYPVLFTCNVRRSVFESFGLTHWKHLKYHGLQIVPVITDQSSGIETRADILKKNIIKMLDKLGVDKAHIVSHSLSGIDARYAIASLGLSNRVYSLTTIATPHRGSKFADIFDKKYFHDKISAPIVRALGVYEEPLVQVVAENMRDFNTVVLNDPNVKYFSIGAEKHPLFCSDLLKDSCKFIRQKTVNHHLYQNDGINGHNQVQWGKHLVNFEYDHFQVVGLNNMFAGEPFQLVTQNLQFIEALDLNKKQLAKQMRGEI